ncbi:MAG: 4-hydroxy-3-methylbut-2-enyl diphosphate reductase [Mycoplasmoidaceae bacterium]
MKITKISPRGFCKGVVDAWSIAKKARIENPNHKIFMIGWLVHNKDMIYEVSKYNITTVDDCQIDRLSIVKKIINENNKDEIVIIFSAHGTDCKAIEYVKNQNVIFYDATCMYVYKTHNLIKDKINENKIIFYIGVKNHPEAIAVKCINPKKIIVIENIYDIKKLEKDYENKAIFITNQTTMSMYDFFTLTKYIKNNFKNVEFKNDICLAAYERQKAILDIDSDVDLLIIVGDKKSNNSNKMVEVGLKMKIQSHLVENVNDLNYEWFKNKKNVAISSGASTPTWTTNKIIKLIENINISD